MTLEPADSLDGRRLVRELWAHLGKLYGDNGPCRFEPRDVMGRGCAFVIARSDEGALGCGAFRPLGPGQVEIKRMFVRPEARRLGVGRAILGALEAEACRQGATSGRLETGVRQPEAIALYEQAGWVRGEPFGRLSGDPLSVWFEKRWT